MCLPNQGKAHPVYHAAGLRKDPALAFTAQPSRFARQRAPASGAFLRRLKFWAPSTAANEDETTVTMSAPVSVKEVEEARDEREVKADTATNPRQSDRQPSVLSGGAWR